jgi:hypothetical protein
MLGDASSEPECHRSLSESVAFDDASWMAYKAKCGDFDYDLSLHIDAHLVLIAEPEEEAVAAGCGALAFHAIPSGNLGNVKEVFMLDVAAEAKITAEGIIKVHTHEFNLIAQAYDEADANAVGMNTYDIVDNNCGEFVKNFASILGLHSTPEDTKFIARRLLEHFEPEHVAKIRNHSNLGQDEDVFDMELVERLVETHTSEFYLK